jgi:hypothetical protein
MQIPPPRTQRSQTPSVYILLMRGTKFHTHTGLQAKLQLTLAEYVHKTLSLLAKCPLKILNIVLTENSRLYCRVPQDDRSVFWEVILSVILSKKRKCIYTYVLFRMASAIKLFHCTVPKLMIRKRYYVLFLIPVFTVQVTKLVQFLPSIINFRKFHRQHQCTLQLV